MKKVTIVIPAYNEADFLPDCLRAIRNQTYNKDLIDVLVIDNNSQDDTAKIARAFQATVIPESEQGYIFALNKGLQSATGEIICITDADSIVPQHWVEEIVKEFADEKVVALTGAVITDAESATIRSLAKRLYSFFLSCNFILRRPHLSGINMAIRRDVFQKIKRIDQQYKISGDVKLGLEAKKFGDVTYLSDLVVITSARRWEKGYIKSFTKYALAYLYVVWLGRPPRGYLRAIR